MAEIRERQTVIDGVPVDRRTVIEEDHPPVVYAQRGLSGGAIAALVIAGIAVAILITMLILNNQQQNRDQELAIERARAEAAERAAAQAQSAPQQSQPPVVVVPPAQPPAIPIPAPMPSQSAPATAPSSSSTSSVSLEVDVNTKLLEDPDLLSHPINVKVENGTATLSGELPSEDLKARAEKIAISVKGIRRVRNNITVKAQ